jgi:hypothetical protein
MPTTTINRNSTSGIMKPLTIKHSFNVGDKVQVVPDVTKLKEMQEGHGGWNPKMAEVGSSFLFMTCKVKIWLAEAETPRIKIIMQF